MDTSAAEDPTYELVAPIWILPRECALLIHLAAILADAPTPEDSPCLEVLASRINHSVRQVRRMLERLEWLGLVCVGYRGGQRTNRYDLRGFAQALAQNRIRLYNRKYLPGDAHRAFQEHRRRT